MRLLLALILAAAALLASPALSRETRKAEAGHTPPPARIEQLSWLVGTWRGTGIGGAPAYESWLPPTGRTMVGTFVQEDGKGAIQFTEHVYIIEKDGSLELRLKHFNADLTGWEEKDGMVTFPLVGMGDKAVWFDGLTFRKEGRKGLIGAVSVKFKDGSEKELVFRYKAAR